MYVIVPILFILTYFEIRKYKYLPYRKFWLLDIFIGILYPILHVGVHVYIYTHSKDAVWENLGHTLFVGYNLLNVVFYIVTGIVTYLSIRWQGRWLENYQPLTR